MPADMDDTPSSQRDWSVETPAWCGPRATSPQSSYDLARDLNMTILLPPCKYGGGYFKQRPSMQLRALNKAAAADVKLILWDDRALEDMTMVDDYPSHGALAGFLLADEPHADMFDAIGWARNIMSTTRPELLGYVNLPAAWTLPEILGTNTYEEYLDLVKEKINPDVWSFDDYGCDQGNDLEQALHTLELVKERAEDKPVWGYIRTVKVDDRPVPDHIERSTWAQAFRDRGVCPAWFTYYCPPGGDGISWDGGFNTY